MRWLLLFLAAPLLAQPNLQDGERLYLGQCSPCHGADGSGGRGPSLNRPRLVNAPDDAALYTVIRRGILGTEMPPTWLAAESVRAIMVHVRKLGRVEQVPLKGNPERGRQLYERGGCANCHTIAGVGGALGPDLDTIGASRSAFHLTQSLIEPEAYIAGRYERVVVRTKDAATIAGVTVAESTFSLQLRDVSGKVHSLWKEEVTDIERPAPRSLMPSYKTVFSAEEIGDLTAFLASLGAAR